MAWQATYQDIDINGDKPTVRVIVCYTNTDDGRQFTESYETAPDQVDTPEFKAMLQDKMNAMDSKAMSLGKATQLISLTFDIAGNEVVSPISSAISVDHHNETPL